MRFLLLASSPILAAALPDAGREALDKGLPLVAVEKIRESDPAAFRGEGDHVALLAQALVEAGRPAEAETILRKLPNRDAVQNFWFGSALAGLGRNAEALAAFEAATGGALSHEAVIGAARALVGLGRQKDASVRLSSAFDWPEGPLRDLAMADLGSLALEQADSTLAERAVNTITATRGPLATAKDFLRAKLLLAKGNAQAASDLFAGIKPLDPAMAVEICIGSARAGEKLRDLAASEAVLEAFIEAHPDLPAIDRVFAELDRVYASEKSPSVSELKRWSDEDRDSVRRNLALYYRARIENRFNRPEVALRLLRKFLDVAPLHPLSNEASLAVAEARFRTGDADGALEVLRTGSSPRAHFLRGAILVAKGDPTSAAESFRSAAADDSLAEVALANAAFCEARAGTAEISIADLRRRFPQSPLLTKALIDDAVQELHAGSPDGARELEAIAAGNDTVAASRAMLALAEWNLSRGDTAAARLQLLKVSTDPEKTAALEVFLAGSESGEAAEAAARRFLQEFAGSPSEPNVRMKLAEILYRRGDYAGARMQFESLARKFPDSGQEEPALFFAAQSASRLLDVNAANDALLLYEEVAGMKGPLASEARFQQAVLQAAQGRPDEAIGILDRLAETAPDADTRFAALVEKGKVEFQLGSKNADGYRRAITTWTAVAQDPAAGPLWKNQALARIGTAHEKLGENDAAIAAFYDVIKSGQSADAPEFFWFYKAGFDAGRILESAQRWDEAIKIYELVAAAPGPRAEEAKARINRLRLENFLWDGK